MPRTSPLDAELEGFRSKSDIAYDSVKRMILGGEIGPGVKINQEQLARSIGMSTTPLREALRRLGSEGLVTLSAHQDAIVTPLSASEARDMFETRLPLDVLAVRLAAERIGDDTAGEICSAAERLTPEIDDPEQYLEAKRRFHQVLYRASRNETLAQVLDGLWDQADRYRRYAIRHGLREESPRVDQHQEHLQLRDAVVAGEAEAAAKLMEGHVCESRDRLLEGLESQDGTE